MIKLKKLLLESPDSIPSLDINFQRNDARAFYLFDNYAFVGLNNDVHHVYLKDGILEALNESSNIKEFIIKLRNKYIVFIGDSSKIDQKYIRETLYANYHRSIGVLCGRLWVDAKVVSFWNLDTDVFKHVKTLVNFLKEYNDGDISGYKVELNHPMIDSTENLSGDEIQKRFKQWVKGMSNSDSSSYHGSDNGDFSSDDMNFKSGSSDVGEDLPSKIVSLEDLVSGKCRPAVLTPQQQKEIERRNAENKAKLHLVGGGKNPLRWRHGIPPHLADKLRDVAEGIRQLYSQMLD